MNLVYAVDSIRAAERATIAGTPEGTLMMRAATALARTSAHVVAGTTGGVYGARIALLVGSGNNGGDALFAGADLLRRGAQVAAVLIGDTAHAQGLGAFRSSGGIVLNKDDRRGEAWIAGASLVVDGIVGIGGQGGLRGRAAQLADMAFDSKALVVAVDVPSGVDADTAVVSEVAVWADVTVTFGALKLGLLVPPGSLHVGMLELVDIGLGNELREPIATCLDADAVGALLPQPHPLDHKYSQGVVGVAAGSARYPGAAVLCVGGALLAKAGLVRYCGSADQHVVAEWPSTIVSTARPADVGRVQAWAVGPGIGVDSEAATMLSEVLDQQLPTAVDADALTLLGDHAELLHEREAPTVLTPHETEFARLADDLDLVADRVGAVRQLAARMKCTVLLKGSTTVVADAAGNVRLNRTGSPWLATAGTGDVLTGLIAAYLAAGLPAIEASSVAAYIHGVAGRLAAEGAPFTSRGLIDAIPAAIRLTRGEEPRWNARSVIH